MRVAVVGAGAVGGLLAAKLAAAGLDVALLARASAVAALRRHGLRVTGAGGPIQAAPAVSDRPETIGRRDLVITAVKAHDLPSVAPMAAELLAPGGALLAVQNGIPWWFPHRLAAWRLRSVDPDGRIWRDLPPDRVLAGVAYVTAERLGDGRIRHDGGDRLVLAAVDPGMAAAAERAARVLATAGFAVEPAANARAAVWTKLLGNVAFNPLSVIHRAGVAELCAEPAVRDQASRMMAETLAVAAAFDPPLAIDVEKRLAAAAALGAVKTSMLQDFERGRPLERAAILDSVRELGERAGVGTPTLDAVAGQLQRIAAP